MNTDAASATSRQLTHDLAVMPLIPVGGIPCRHLTLRGWALLRQFGSPFVTGGRAVDPEDLAVLLWVISPIYSMDAGARDRFVRKIIRPALKRSAPALMVAAYQYTARAFQGAPGAEWFAACGAPALSDASIIVDTLAREYGWSDEAILSMPLARVWQYLAAISRRSTPAPVSSSATPEPAEPAAACL